VFSGQKSFFSETCKVFVNSYVKLHYFFVTVIVSCDINMKHDYTVHTSAATGSF